MKRLLLMLVLCVLMVGVVVMPASAESAATKAESYVNVNAEGDCIVALTVTLHLEASYQSLTFPLPLDATNITMNGSTVRTVKTATATEVDVAKAIKDRWLINWQKNGWVNSAKKPVKNQDLWKRMPALLTRHQVHFHWLKGHAGHADICSTPQASGGLRPCFHQQRGAADQLRGAGQTLHGAY